MIQLSIDGRMAHISLNAPDKLNALDHGALEELSQAYDEAAAASVRALILSGEGRAFCAGRDIANVDPEQDDVKGYLDGLLAPLLRKISAFPAPTFAAVQGACLGVGLGLAIATDVVYVASDAKIGSPFANLGATLDSGGHALFVERLGAHRALDLIYTGELMSGRDAVAAGLFSRAVDSSELLEFTWQKAQKASVGATQAFLASKRLVAEVRDEHIGLWGSMAHETAAQAQLCRTDDYREGFAAFAQKRHPHFSGEAAMKEKS